MIISCCRKTALLDEEDNYKGIKNCYDNYDGPLDIIWSRVLHEDSAQEGSMTPFVFDDVVLFNKNTIGAAKNTIYAFDIHTGNKVWEWNDFDRLADWTRIHDHRSSQAMDNKFFFDHGLHKILIDVKSGQKIWSYETEDSFHSTGSIGDWFYFVQWESEARDSSFMIRVHKDDKYPRPDTVFKCGNKELFEFPALWMNSDNDSILVWESVEYFPNQHNAIGYNLNKDKLEFYYPGFTTKSDRPSAPIIYNDIAIMILSNAICGINLLTGRVIWERTYPITNFYSTLPIIREDKLIIAGQVDLIAALDPNTGNTIWERNDLELVTSNELSYYAGGVYFSVQYDWQGYMKGLDINTGEEFFSVQAPYTDCFPTTAFLSSPRIDESTGRLYRQDGINAYCIQLKER